MPDRHEPPGTTNPSRGQASRQLRTGLACVVAGITLTAAGCAGASPITPVGPASAASTATATAAPAGKGGTTLPGTGYPTSFWATIRQQLASSLHRSVTELTRLWAPVPSAGPKGTTGQLAATTITDVAIEDGLSTEQLRSIEFTAIRHAFTAVVRRGTITRSQADSQLAIIAGWDQDSLDGYAMYAFQPH
jgi:hypothetical protein